MSEITKNIIEEAKASMEKAISHLENELVKIRAGRATPQLVDSLTVDYYGSPTPLSQIANINTPDAKTIVIQPWEKTMLTAIEKAIQAANLGINPQNDGVVIRLVMPPLTEERRKDLVKKAKQEAENAKVIVRGVRRDANEAVKKAQKDGLPEDIGKDCEGKVQVLTDQYIVKADKHLEVKEKEIMTV